MSRSMLFKVVIIVPSIFRMRSSGNDQPATDLLRLLTTRLERLSADSHWARRASGLRGNMLKVLEEIETGQEVTPDRLNLLIESGFEILRRAAQEIPDLEVSRKTPR